MDGLPRGGSYNPSGGWWLVVDDDPEILSVIASILEDEFGTNVIPCSSGDAAWDAYKNVSGVQGIVTDWDMPGMDGLELSAKIHELDMDLPIILITGRRDDLNWNRMRNSGVRQVITKPFSCKGLISAVRQCLVMTGCLAAA
jgi:CheY-like chemotaxis protein